MCYLQERQDQKKFKNNKRKFGFKHARHINEFNSKVDYLFINHDSFKHFNPYTHGDTRVANNKKERKFLERHRTAFVYESRTGKLFYNHNTHEKGFGREGGLIAYLPKKLDPSIDTLFVNWEIGEDFSRTFDPCLTQF